MNPALIRILLYILSGVLVRGGWLPDDMAHELSNNPDMVWLFEAAASAVIGAGTLLWWRIAKRMGWNT
jgi:hypothetical protein